MCANLCRVITLANLPYSLLLEALYCLEVRFPNNLVILLFNHITGLNHRHEVLRLSDLPLKALPDLVAGQDWGGSGGIDLLGVGTVDRDHGDVEGGNVTINVC